MKNPIGIALLFFISFSSVNTSAQNWLWVRGNTGVGVDAWPVAADESGNVFVAGISLQDSIAARFGTITVPSSTGGTQTVVAKYDGNGNVLWATGTKSGNTWLFNIATDPSGDLVVFGAFTDSNMQIGAFTLTNTNPSVNSYQYFLAKFDPSGNVLWAVNAGNPETYSVAGFIAYVLGMGGVATDASGNIYITTSFKLPTVTIGSFTLTNSDPTGNTSDIMLAKYDPTGTVIWAASAGGSQNDYAFGITVTQAGDIYIAGDFASPSVTFGSSVITDASASPVAFIARYNASGAPVWACGSGGNGGEYAVGIAADASDNVYLTGGLTDNSITFSGATINNPTPGHSVLYLVKFDASNNVSWYKTIYDATAAKDSTRQEAGTWGYSIAMSQCGVIWVSGAMQDSVNIDGHILHIPNSFSGPIQDSATDPVFIAGYTSAGIYAWSAALPSGGDDQNGIACDAIGNIYMGCDYEANFRFIAGPDTLPGSDASAEELLYVAKFPVLNGAAGNFKHTENTVCYSDGLTLNAIPGYTYNAWSNGSEEANYTVTDTGLVWVYSYDSCGATFSDSFDVVVPCNCERSLFVPNAFTPNGDGQDDVFYPRCGYGISEIKSFSVYNRWGELLFERNNLMPNDATNAWDGTYKGEPPVPEVYVWMVEGVCEAGGTFNKKGSVTIIR